MTPKKWPRTRRCLRLWCACDNPPVVSVSVSVSLSVFVSVCVCDCLIMPCSCGRHHAVWLWDTHAHETVACSVPYSCALHHARELYDVQLWRRRRRRRCGPPVGRTRHTTPWCPPALADLATTKREAFVPARSAEHHGGGSPLCLLPMIPWPTQRARTPAPRAAGTPPGDG